MILGFQAMSSRQNPYDADYIYPESLANPTAAESKMTAALGDLPLGGTADGKAWCRKALHPADHEIMATRYPGGSTVPTVSSNFTQVMELVPDSTVAEAQTWDARIFIRQDPIVPVSVELTTRGTARSSVVRFPWMNRTLTDHVLINDGTYSVPGVKKYNAAVQNFLRGKNFYRITHLGLTVEHVSSSTTNQGTVLSGQYAIEPVTTTMAGHPSTVIDGDNLLYGVPANSGKQPGTKIPPSGVWHAYTAPHIRHYYEGPMDPEMLLQATNGYTGSARDGLYIPLKLNAPDRLVNVDKKYVLFGYKEDSDVYERQIFGDRKHNNGASVGWPYYFLNEPWSVDQASGPVYMFGCKECGTAISDTVIRGLDPRASLRLYLRVGVEYIPEIDTETACFARMSPLPDELAVRMYQEIACRMKDAFPRDYNDKSRLLKVINSYAKKLVPMIDRGLNFFAKIPGNPWAGAANGLRVLTQAYTAPPQSTTRKGSGKKKQARASSPSQPSPSVRAGSVITLQDPNTKAYWQAKITRPAKKAK